MRALIYARVSTADKGQNPEVQASALREYCNARGWTLSAEIIDHGYSGGTDKRPGLAQLMAMVRTRKVDVVVVVKMDRLFRSLKHLVTMLDEFQGLGVQFVSVGDHVDLSTASGRLMTQILGAFSEFERGIVRERTLAGLAYAKSKGKRLGRPTTTDFEAIRELRHQGLSQAEIRTRLNVSKGAIWRALRSSPKSPQNRSKKT